MINDEIVFSIIVPAFNEEELLGATLDRLNQILALIPDKGEIIVSDNNSTDNTAEIAEQYGARVVFEPHQQIARARNTGGKVSNAPYLFFVDADTLVTDNLICTSLDALKSGSISGGGALPTFPPGSSNDKAVQWATAFWTWLSRQFKWACGAYVFCRKDAFDAVSGFDEAFYASEEIHFSRAVNTWGKKQNKKFIILESTIETSARKIEWFGIWGLFIMTLPILLCPFLMRSRKFCQMWYVRPE